MTGQRHAVRDGSDAGARHQPVGRDAAIEGGLEDGAALAEVEGIGLAGGPEQRDAGHAVGDQLPAMGGEKRKIRRKIGGDGRCRGAEDAADREIAAHAATPAASFGVAASRRA